MQQLMLGKGYSRTAIQPRRSSHRHAPRLLLHALTTAGLFTGLFLGSSLISDASAATAGHALAVSVDDFNYIDTSNEPTDQTAVHQKQLRAFMTALRDDVTADCIRLTYLPAYLAPLRRAEWVVYAKRPFGGPQAVLAYLSRYTHRVAIANSRLIACDRSSVTFRWKDYRAEGRDRQKLMTLATAEFIRRFLIHVLPHGFHRIRHYGLLASGTRADNIARARELLAVSNSKAEPTAGAVDPGKPTCPCCGGRMIIIEVFERGATPRHRPAAPPIAIRADTS